MNRASPADLRKAMYVAQTYTKAGILFVCMPVLNVKDGLDLLNQAEARLEQICQQAEAEEAQQ